METPNKRQAALSPLPSAPLLSSFPPPLLSSSPSQRPSSLAEPGGRNSTVCMAVTEGPLDRGLMAVTRPYNQGGDQQHASNPCMLLPSIFLAHVPSDPTKGRGAPGGQSAVQTDEEQPCSSPLSPCLPCSCLRPILSGDKWTAPFSHAEELCQLLALTTMTPAGTLPSGLCPPAHIAQQDTASKKDLRGIPQASKSSVCLSVCL